MLCTLGSAWPRLFRIRVGTGLAPPLPCSRVTQLPFYLLLQPNHREAGNRFILLTFLKESANPSPFSVSVDIPINQWPASAGICHWFMYFNTRKDWPSLKSHSPARFDSMRDLYIDTLLAVQNFSFPYGQAVSLLWMKNWEFHYELRPIVSGIRPIWTWLNKVYLRAPPSKASKIKNKKRKHMANGCEEVMTLEWCREG